MWFGLSILGSLFYLAKKKTPPQIAGFRIIQESLPGVDSKGSITFYWTPSPGTNFYSLLVYYPWNTKIEGLKIEYFNNTAVLTYDSVVTNQEKGQPNVVFNIRANNDVSHFSEHTKTSIRHELKNFEVTI
jgi:hypothetical protein